MEKGRAVRLVFGGKLEAVWEMKYNLFGARCWNAESSNACFTFLLMGQSKAGKSRRSSSDIGLSV